VLAWANLVNVSGIAKSVARDRTDVDALRTSGFSDIIGRPSWIRWIRARRPSIDLSGLARCI
jgi:hypothetical protein